MSIVLYNLGLLCRNGSIVSEEALNIGEAQDKTRGCVL